MMKRFAILIAVLLASLSTSFAAGTIPGFSLAQQQDELGNPLIGCKLYTIQAGTVSTPQTAYQDSALTIPLSYPVLCDAYGRLPQIFLADGSIKLRLTKSTGVQVFAADGILVVGASSGGGGGSPVDATTILATGDLKARYGVGVLSGFVRLNGRTIGSATSGATERANADVQALFEYLYDADTNLAVSGGRGASAAADWAANKTLALPDWRGRALAALADMGNSATTVLTSTYCGTSPIVLGNGCGAQTHTILQTHLPSATLSTSITDPGHFHTSTSQTAHAGQVIGNLGLGAVPAPTTLIDLAGVNTGSKTTGITASTALGGGNTPISIVPPMMLATFYIKL